MTVFIKAAIDDLVGLDLPKLKQDIIAAVDYDNRGLQDICINGKTMQVEIDPDGFYMEVYF